MAQLRLAEPVLLLPGDRFILRQFSPVVTIGGGVVLDAAPLVHKRPVTEVVSFLRTMATGSPEEVLAARVARRGETGFRLTDVPAEMNLPAGRALKLAAHLAEQGILVGCHQLLLSQAAFAHAETVIADTARKFHDANPLVSGISKEELREKTNLGPEVFYAVLEKLAEEKKLELSGELVRLAGRGVVMKDEEAASKNMIESTFAAAGLKVPALKDVLAGLRVDKARAQKIVTLLLRDKVLMKISEDLVFHRDALQDLRTRMAAEKAKSPKIDIARFKDLTGVSRKYAIPLLEYLDREHVTRRVGDERVIL